jgi:exopolysaccharide biosynthesis WecB/TagA/CpsF family protein
MTPGPVPRLNVLGVGIAATDLAAAAELVVAAAVERRAFAASALAVHAVMEAQSDPAYRARLNHLDLAAPDGQPVRWALNVLHGARLTDRVYGPFLMRRVCARAAELGLPVYFFGTTAPTLRRLTENLAAAYPDLRVAGTRPSRFRRATAAEAEADAAAIAASGARIVFCGLGCPRQEAWVHALRPLVAAPLVGVGAAFALWAGDRAMAPAWMQARGLEWLFRLLQEPDRLARRYVIQGPGYFAGLAHQYLGDPVADIAPTPVAPDYWG